jgi:hypothetical protein
MPLGFQQVEVPKISKHFAHEGDKIVGPKHQPPYPIPHFPNYRIFRYITRTLHFFDIPFDV